VRLEGLSPTAMYRVVPLDAKKVPGLAVEVNGSQLMGEGIQFNLRGDYDAVAVRLERIQ